MSLRVTVRLPNWLGDTVMAVPAVRSLAGAGASLTLVGGWAWLLDGQGLAQAGLAYPRGSMARWRLGRAIARLRPDVAVVCPGSFEAALAAWRWGAARRVGFATDGRAWLLTDALDRPRPRRHQVDEYVVLAERLEATVACREPRLAPPPAGTPARDGARALLAAEGLGPARGRGPAVGVHLGAAYGRSKVWDPERVAALCATIAARGGRPVLLGAPGDAGTAEEVRGRVPVASLVGRDSLAVVPGVLSEIDALVAGDTGVAHLAAALGCAVVTLFGPTDPALTAPRGPRVAVVRRAVPCAPCFYRECPIEHPCLAGIEVEEVVEAVWGLLGS